MSAGGRLVLACLLSASFLLAPPSPDAAPGKPDRSTPVRFLQGLNALMQACWIQSRDRAFRDLRVIPELDTRTGKPRILIVKAKAAQGLPELVIEATGRPARLNSYGPLAKTALIVRMESDVVRWIEGDTGCKPKA